MGLNTDISSGFEFNAILCVHALEQEARCKVFTKSQNPPSIIEDQTACQLN